MKFSLTISFAILVLISQGQQLTSTDYMIYSTIIKHTISEKSKSVVIINKTGRKEYEDPFSGDTATHNGKYNSFWEMRFHTPFNFDDYKFLRNYDQKRFKSKKVTKRFTSNVQVLLLSQHSVDKLFKNNSVPNGWELFYKLYPSCDGVYQFSDVSYSIDKTKATVFYSVHRNGLNGKGVILILNEINGEWKISQTGSLWAN